MKRTKTLPFLILLFLYQRVSAAQDPKTITVQLGENVTLPCRAPNSNNLAGVEWNKAGLEPKYVLLLRDGHFVPDNQQPSFKDRVDLQDEQMKNGDVTLILKKVTATDGGTYECRILTQGEKRRKRAVETIKVINLHVDPPGQTGGHTEGGSVGMAVGLSVSAVILVAVAAVVVSLIYKKHKKQQSQDSYQPPAEQQSV